MNSLQFDCKSFSSNAMGPTLNVRLSPLGEK